MLSLTIQNAMNDDIFPVEIEESGTVEDIKVLICAEKGIAVEEQVLMHNQRILGNNMAKVS
jgi:hypothetical protein